jgi:hypothetical protein
VIPVQKEVLIAGEAGLKMFGRSPILKVIAGQRGKLSLKI